MSKADVIEIFDLTKGRIVWRDKKKKNEFF